MNKEFLLTDIAIILKTENRKLKASTITKILIRTKSIYRKHITTAKVCSILRRSTELNIKKEKKDKGFEYYI